MPRKNRRTALVLVLALLACLAGQAAAALPVRGGSQAAANDSTAGDLLSAVWGWLADKCASLGHLIAAPAGQGAWEKAAAGTDPNGGCVQHGPQGPNATVDIYAVPAGLLLTTRSLGEIL